MTKIFARSLVLAAFLPGMAFAVGSDDDTPPTPTETTKTCEDGYVWDKDTKECVTPKDARLNDDTRYGAVREYAYDGQLNNALKVLASMEDQNSDRVLTYKGFVARKQGHWGQAMEYYGKALAQNPDNHLARSYMAQGLAAAGATDAAILHLAEIRTRGGAGSWAEKALEQVINGEAAQSY